MASTEEADAKDFGGADEDRVNQVHEHHRTDVESTFALLSGNLDPLAVFGERGDGLFKHGVVATLLEFLDAATLLVEQGKDGHKNDRHARADVGSERDLEVLHHDRGVVQRDQCGQESKEA